MLAATVDAFIEICWVSIVGYILRMFWLHLDVLVVKLKIFFFQCLIDLEVIEF